ncbi:hypothetical protein [Wolbachia endosymbiont of Aedes albopictus]|uniref:hypothetical protein n=1 Tax=Wolbachia endosymbiont of Aedes albopictus TaxID=167957 RepID=UPI000BBCB6F6|nr:hypothetical protein [Wolbachia endosymbiont of Aedes albopictus]UVW84286.1 hypothetical protein NHG98_02125 [Wolbachia endosymbiont of Aedes albopictus]
MYDEKNKLAHRKKVRTYSKRLVTTLSTISFIGYIAALVLNIPVLSLYFSIAGTILSALSFALNIWSLKDHFLQKQLGVAGQKKLTKICLDITSNVSFLIGGIASILPLESSIIPFLSTAFFILGCVIMAANIVQTMISKPQIEENNNVKGGHPVILRQLELNY